MHLLAAAIGHKSPWGTLNEAVSGAVINYWSSNDYVLGAIYKTVQAGQTAAGAVEIKSPWPRIKNRNMSRCVKGHSEYFSKIRLVREVSTDRD